MLRIFANRSRLVLEYSTGNGVFWAHERLSSGGEARLSRGLFRFRRPDALSPIAPAAEELENEFEIQFILGEKRGPYFKIEGRKLGTTNDVYVSTEFPIEVKHFVVARGTSVFRTIDGLVDADIYIGGERDGAIPIEVFGEILSAMPTDVELKKYVMARASSVLKNYLDQTKDAETAYQKYRNRREAFSSERRASSHLSSLLLSHEVAKDESILDRLQEMLENEVEYSEASWQRGIADVLTLLYPKYIAVLREGPIIRDEYSSNLSVDFVLVDSEGHIDLLEIKKPGVQQVMTKGTYRDNLNRPGFTGGSIS